MDYPKWHFGTSVHLDFGTFGLWHICISSFPLLSYKWGTLPWKPFQPFLHPIIVQMGDAAIDTHSSPTPAPHYRTNGGRCHGRLSSPSCASLSYKWGTLPWKTFHPFLRLIIVQMGDASMEAFPALPAPHYRTNGGRIPYGCPF